MSEWILSAIVIFCAVTIMYLISRFLKRNDIMDLFWGPGFALVAAINYFYSPDKSVWKLILLLIVSIWAFRLSAHIYVKNKGKSEDFRYENWRKEWGKSEWWRSYLQVYLLQGLFMYIVALPLTELMQVDNGTNNSPALYMYLIPSLIAISGLVIEAAADYQKSIFKNQHPDGLMKEGLWQFSRHPNYFGDALFWWGIGLFSVFLGSALPGIISALTMTILLRYVSGVPMLEKAKKGNKAYEQYKKETPVFVPFLKP